MVHGNVPLSQTPKKVKLWIPSFPFRDFGRSHQWLNRPFTAKNLHIYEIYEGFPIPSKKNLTCVNHEAFNRRKDEKKKESFLGIWTKTTSSTCSWLICWSFAEPDHRRHEMHKRSRGTKPQAHGRWGYKNHQGISWKFKGTPAIATETRPY